MSLSISPQASADWMVGPAMAGPVDDKRPAGQLEAESEEEKCSPGVSQLVDDKTVNSE